MIAITQVEGDTPHVGERCGGGETSCQTGSWCCKPPCEGVMGGKTVLVDALLSQTIQLPVMATSALPTSL